MKKAFTMIEILVAMILLGFLIVGSVKAMGYLRDAHQINELRYLALNKIDSEMARLVYAYREVNQTNFTNPVGSSTNAWDDEFDINVGGGAYKVYSANPITENYGLLIDINNSLIELKNISGNFGTVDNNDIIGLLGWRISIDNVKKESNISLSIKYPYRWNNPTLSKFRNFNETINLKTSTRIK